MEMITKNEEKAARIQIYLEAQEDWLADIAEVLGRNTISINMHTTIA
jgi:hypothetical protein